ncbi:hypothetical protein SMD22_01465 (plasmid) [Brevibacillus halotolerans]|nr:hypothetical protein SMD22_01465 [Brevibacillus halotolerans]
MRKRNRGNIRSSTLFIQAIEEANNELSIQRQFLKDAIQNPELIFSLSDQYFGSKNLLSHVMNRSLIDDTKLQVHDFQAFLADLTNQFVQSWASNHGIAEEVSVEVRQTTSYPSIFAVYHKNIELIQFSIIGKFYGIREVVKKEEQIREEYDQYQREKEEKRACLSKKIEKYMEIKRDPYVYIRNHYKNLNKKGIRIIWREICEYFLITFKKKKLSDGIDKKIADLQSQLDAIEKYEDSRMNVEDEIVLSESRSTLTKALLPLFQEYNYVLEEKKNRLY